MLRFAFLIVMLSVAEPGKVRHSSVPWACIDKTAYQLLGTIILIRVPYNDSKQDFLTKRYVDKAPLPNIIVRSFVSLSFP